MMCDYVNYRLDRPEFKEIAEGTAKQQNDGRADMYVDIALSYAVLGFISSLIVARYLERKGEDHGN